MKESSFHTELWLPHPRIQVFPFFANANNLRTITPPWLGIELLNSGPLDLHAGALLDYRICVHGITVRWRTEISEWNPPERFVDVQQRGPYLLWRHTHTFHEKDGGTLCLDDVRYHPRGGAFMNWLFVRRDIARIFRYRQERLRDIFREGSQS